MSLDSFLKETSQQASDRVLDRLRKEYNVLGHLAESSAGSIRVVRKTKSVTRKDRIKTDRIGAFVRKTIDLDSQNYQALIKKNWTTSRTKIARGLDFQDIVFGDPHRKTVGKWASLQGRPWKSNSMIVKIAQAKKTLAKERDGANLVWECNEFLNEAAIGHIVTQELANVVPHFVKQHAAWIHDGVGHLLMDYAGVPFEKASIAMTPSQCQSVLLQIILGLHVAFEKTHFKHHDLHLENIFVHHLSSKDTFQEKPLTESAYWAQNVKTSDETPRVIYVKHENILARMGDYGLSSITDPKSMSRVERIDQPDLDASEIEWGRFEGTTVNGHSGGRPNSSQDLVTLLSKFYLDDELQQVPEDFALMCQKLFDALQVEQGFRASEIGRPLTFWTSPEQFDKNIHIIDILQKQMPDVFVKPDASVVSIL